MNFEEDRLKPTLRYRFTTKVGFRALSSSMDTEFTTKEELRLLRTPHYSAK